jgi:hypothetical protein
MVRLANEATSAFIEQTGHEIGRLLEALRKGRPLL